jgi:hypothetical protein
VRIKVEFEVEDINELRSVLQAGRDYTLYDCNVVSVEVLTPADKVGTKLHCDQCDIRSIKDILNLARWNWCPYCGRQLRA